ncbi:hypothetical protein KBD33_03855 [Candidatus Gracilibacteria bacterium]|nr:hypothetical protein [Candidatus Gracilibacteria bacterium]
MRKRSFSFPWKKYISALLIGILVFSQTVRVDFFDSALATSEDDYRDIVSIIVDETTYSRLESKIKNYANNIQGYLGSTRVSLIIVKSGVEPARIAAMNEKLYLEGEGNTKVTRLVGTILIGNIPIPMVVDDGEHFPSMYPYVDFVDKAFVYNSKSHVYEKASESNSQVVEADIWHGVINPAVGRDWSDADISKISQFLDKTDAFYHQRDMFIPSTLPPRVFYYDGEYESDSVSGRSLFQYGLAIKNAENLAYKRFTKYLLSDINKVLEDFDKTENAALNTLVQSKGKDPHGSSFSPEVIASMPDIQTKVPIQTLLKDFQSIINKKTLSDAYANIHNAGRYNSGPDVRADIGPIRMTILDEIARTTLKEANDAMMPKVEDDIRAVQQNYNPLRIPGWADPAGYFILSRYEIERYDYLAKNPCDDNQYITDTKKYTNYRFGKTISESNDPESCSIARGGAFPASQPGMYGKDVTVEANKAYDVNSVNIDINTLSSQDSRKANKNDQPGGVQCLEGPKIGTFWKDNSVLRIVRDKATNAKEVFETVSTPTGYSLPIYSLGGMKDNGGIPAPRLSDCQSNYQYVLRAPSVEQSYACTVTTGNGESETTDVVSCQYGWPTENFWQDTNQECSQQNDSGGYTCFTSHEAGSNIDLFAADGEIKSNDPIINKYSCIIGSVLLDGSTLGNETKKRGDKKTDPCMKCYSGCGGGPDDEPQYIDLYEKRTYFFTKMQSPILRHISPTDEEIRAAENSGITKSLPVDMVRSVEYLWGHAKEGIDIVNRMSEHRVLYPNFFSLGFGNDVISARNWLNSLGASQGWADGSIKYWGTGAYISTGSLEKIINARNWLTSDVTSKYRRAVETSLSYTQIDPSRELYQQVPQYPVSSNGYEIAYLGLSSFTPGSVGNSTATNVEREYELRRAEIEGINISEPHEQGDKNPYAESDKCGPPEGVDIFKWPAAIMCWMQTLLPPRIIAGSCGSNTIGGDSSSSSPLVSPPAGFSSGAVGMRNFYAGGKLTYSTERTHMNYGDSLAIDFEYTKDNKRLNLPADSYLELQITARDKNGSIIAPSDYGRYFSLAPQKVMTTGAGGSFLITSKDKNVTITFQAKPSIILPGKEIPPFVGGSSDLITINISSEYLRIVPKRGDIEGYSFDTIQSGDITFSANIIDDTGTAPSATLDYLTVVDDVTGSIVYTGSFTSSSILPSKIRNTIGVYRIILRDTAGRTGEATLALTAGVLHEIVISPVSPKIKKGSNTLVVIHLKDSKGNPISPDLNSVELKVTGGYLSDVKGEEKTEMKIDSMEAGIPLLVGSKTTGTMSITATVGGVSTTQTISVLDDIKVKMIPPTSSPLQVGGLPVKMRIEVQDVSNVRISGFNSVASIDIPQGVGTADLAVIDIKDGSGSFVFTPGTRSGTHPVKFDIPGIGSVSSEIILTSGVPMYISHVENEKTDSIDFILNDRYGNIVRENLVGTGTVDATPFSFSFSNGIYSRPKTPGYYTLNVASLATSVISYTDDSGIHTSVGIPFYATYIADNAKKFDFLPDYNARYSVLYGDSYLREGEDILFDTSPKLSQSLAVTTLLDSPFAKETLATVFPGGRISLSDSLDDAIVEATVTLKSGGYPSVHLQEIVAQKSLGDIQYQFVSAKLTPCTSNCDVGLVGPEIRLIPNTGIGFEGKVEGTKLTLKNENIELFSIDKTGKMVLSEGVTLELLQDNPTEGLLLDILAGGSSIGEIVLYTDPALKVITSGSPLNTPLISSSNQVTLEKVYHTSLNGTQVGYSFIIAGGVTRSIDEKKIGPRGVDSFALTHDTPGIGWGGNNKTLLSYAAGDTVGEATRWFHTYTMINMGDPVAHVDHDAPGTRVEGIDRTIGTQITSNLRSEVASYALRDMDNDTYEDIVTLDTDGYVSLYSNLRTRFRYRQDIAYVPDLVERGISLGDLAGDGYADIIGLDHSGSLVLIENTERKMTRINMKLSGVASMPSGITDFKIFNMDNKEGDDIVYMNESGELGILYYNNSTNDFTKKIVDSTLGVTLPGLLSSKGGAIYFDGLPQIPPEEFGVTPEGSTSLDDTVLQSEVYHQFTQSSLDTTEYKPTEEIDSYEDELQDDLGMDGDALGSSVGSSLGSETSTYVKSQYAGVYDLDVTRSWEKVDKTNNTLHSGDQILAKIEIKNNGGARSNIKYLDTLSENLDASEALTYRAYLKGSSPSGSDPLPPFTYVSDGDYDVMFEYDEIPAGGRLVFEYELRALPARPGELSVGLMEKGEAGNDDYGDIAFNGSTSCGADRLIWRSRSSREYDPRGTRSFTQPVIPPTLRSQIVDNQDEDRVKKSNGIPDSIDNATPSITDYKNLSKTTTSSSEPLVKWTTSSDKRIEIGFDSKAVDNINSMVKDMQDGLACGFGGGSCMSFPINWAPLAPGQSPSVFGYPLNELIPGEGKTLMSGLTWMTNWCGPSTCCLPGVYVPASPFNEGFGVGKCGPESIGGDGGTWDPSNFFRIYVTPTLTLGMGGAVCFGGPAKDAGVKPSHELFGFVQGGNCIVTAKPMPFCKGDGTNSDGDVKGVSGLGSITDTWNAGSCRITSQNYGEVDDGKLTDDIVSYLRKSPGYPSQENLYKSLSQRPAKSITTGPLLRIGGGSAGGTTEVGIEIDTSKPFTLGNIVKIKNGRVPAFPDFIMSWVNDQLNELINALFTAPNLIVVLPGAVGSNMQFDGNWQDFQKKFTDAYSSQSLENIKTQMGQAYNANNVAPLIKIPGGTKTGLSQDFSKWQNNLLSGSAGKTIGQAQGGLASVRAAYKLIGQLPFITLRKQTVPINVPWILPRELDKYARSLENYKREYEDTLKNWCIVPDSPKCIQGKLTLNSSGFMSSISKNLSRIEEYKKFPAKLQKYVTWKQQYMSQILCNVDTIRQMLGGWIKDNGVRFRKWAELYVLIKAIAESWQPLIDVFRDTSRKCDVCHNQRNSTVDWKLKLLSALLPSPPIMKFPRWPDIILDLSDIKLGINISVPDFKFNIKPIRLPSLPTLSLPESPTASLTLPKLPILPAIPKLPDLPELPSLPKIVLPNLPPPPKIPKLFGSIEVAINIFKIYGTIKCFLNDTFLAPEGEVGDIIAHKTERQGTLDFDFLGIKFPNFTLPTVQELRVSTHVNFNIRSEFITEFAKQAVKPVNEFTTDIGRTMPSKIGNDIKIDNPIPDQNITPGAYMSSTGEYLASLKEIQDIFDTESSILLDTSEFRDHILRELTIAGRDDENISLKKELKKSEEESEELTETLLALHNQKFDVLTQYIQAEYDSTAELQNIIDMITDDGLGDLSTSDIYGPSQLVNSDASDKTDRLLSEYNTLNTYTLPDDVGGQSYARMNNSLNGLQRSMKQVANAMYYTPPTGGSTSSSDPSAGPIPDGYAPIYEGVFVLTPSGIQTRLFDATEGLSSSERIEVVDIDKDGDKDYIFRLDGAIYIKYSTLYNPPGIKDYDIKTNNLTTTSSLPGVPNYFHESYSTPKNLNISFQPNSPHDEKEWRIQMYDAYKEGNTTEHVIDLYVEEDEVSIPEDSEYSESLSIRSISLIGDKDSFQLLSPEITVISKDQNSNFTLSAGRKIYTGKDGAVINYLKGSEPKTVTLNKNKIYTFRDAITATITSGKLYVFSETQTRTLYKYSDDFIGMPMVSGMEMTVEKGQFKISENTQGSSYTEFSKGSHYSLRSVGEISSEYSLTIPYSNGMYSARIERFDIPKDQRVYSNVVLFSPQSSNDSNAPIIDTPDVIRIPVYATGSLDLARYVSEMNDYSILFDEDIAKDTITNGVPYDDFVTEGSKMKLKDDEIFFEVQTTLSTYTALLKITDEGGNVAFKDLNIEIYAPIPQIENITEDGATGSLDEVIPNEPIHLFRVRPGQSIEQITTAPIMTDKDGKFSNTVPIDNTSNINIRVSGGATVAQISPKGAIINPLSGYRINVTPASSTSPLKFDIVDDSTSKSVYTQFMFLSESTPILSTGEYTSGDAVVVIPSSGYISVKAATDDPSIPGGMYIVKEDTRDMVAAIAEDGNIYGSAITIEYSTLDGYMLLTLSRGGTEIAKLHYKTSFFYTVK